MPATPRARRTANEETITVTIRPLYGEQKTIVVPVNSTVSDLLSNAAYPENAEVRLIAADGVSVLATDSILEDGDVLQIVSGKKIVNG